MVGACFRRLRIVCLKFCARRGRRSAAAAAASPPNAAPAGAQPQPVPPAASAEATPPLAEPSVPKSPDSYFFDGDTSLMIHLSFGGPTGWLGVAVNYAFAEQFVIAAGVGLGASGPQVSLLPRLRLPVGRMVALGVEAGPSAGRYVHSNCVILCDVFEADRSIWDTALWMNGNGVLEVARKRFRMLAYLGYGHLLNYDSCKPENDGCTGDEPTGLWHLGLAFGASFSDP